MAVWDTIKWAWCMERVTDWHRAELLDKGCNCDGGKVYIELSSAMINSTVMIVK